MFKIFIVSFMLSINLILFRDESYNANTSSQISSNSLFSKTTISSFPSNYNLGQYTSIASESESEPPRPFEIKNIQNLKFGFIAAVSLTLGPLIPPKIQTYSLLVRILVSNESHQASILEDTSDSSKIKIKFNRAAEFSITLSESAKQTIIKENKILDLKSKTSLDLLLMQKVDIKSLEVQDITSDDLIKTMIVSKMDEPPSINVALWTVNIKISGINWIEGENGFGAPLGENYKYESMNDSWEIISDCSEEVEMIYSKFVESGMSPWYLSTGAIIFYAIIGVLLLLAVVFIMMTESRNKY